MAFQDLQLPLLGHQPSHLLSLLGEELPSLPQLGAGGGGGGQVNWGHSLECSAVWRWFTGQQNKVEKEKKGGRDGRSPAIGRQVIGYFGRSASSSLPPWGRLEKK